MKASSSACLPPGPLDTGNEPYDATDPVLLVLVLGPCCFMDPSPRLGLIACELTYKPGLVEAVVELGDHGLVNAGWFG